MAEVIWTQLELEFEIAEEELEYQAWCRRVMKQQMVWLSMDQLARHGLVG